MKVYKLIHHPKTFGNADILLSARDFPNVKFGDIVEIYHPEDEFSRLLLQITNFKEDVSPGKDTISIEQSIAATFQLRMYGDVIVNKVDFHSVTLDSVEVTFKDQYIGRSEMWRLKNALINTCVYLNKKIECCGGLARVQVHEMWFQGERVACGAITGDTKLVFRSSTSMVYLFLQMSSEMWEFDRFGDLYFEKAVNGFLANLFQKWKRQGSNHEVTIVLFTRAFYKATSLEEFPEYMRECLQRDYRGCFYEDFYRVAVQNEKYEDWMGTLILLKNLFKDYKKAVLEYHKKPGMNNVPSAYLSTASHGNFLEVLNISLNVFEKHFLERSLDRTGQLSVVISPGVGVFEVDRELTNVTKQRTIDNGVASDLVCVGDEPLHAVPLFKFHNKDETILRDDYSMPHWINLSFYSSNKKSASSNFMPRIKLPPKRVKSPQSNVTRMFTVPKPKLPTDMLEEAAILGNSVSPYQVDYDSYDNQVFTLPPTHSASVKKMFSKTKKLSLNQDMRWTKWKMSDPDIYRSQLTSHFPLPKSPSIGISDVKASTANISSSYSGHVAFGKSRPDIFNDEELSPTSRTLSVNSSLNSAMYSPCTAHFDHIGLRRADVGGAQGHYMLPGKALINPFDPSHITVKLTSNRRRWTHVFPKGPTGVVMQQHHYNNSPELDSDGKKGAKSRMKTNCVNQSTTATGKQTLLWGVTGEQEWTPSLTTGVDWKSLTIPACLPITTDYFPEEECLKTDYFFSDYSLLPDDVNSDYATKRAIYRDPLTTNKVFQELVCQRLAQGFQLILEAQNKLTTPNTLMAIAGKPASTTPVTECKLSIGRIFHKLTLCGSAIRVTRYRPRHPYPPFVIHYRYRFQAPDHITYGISWVSFNAEKLENFNWNYLDHYICTRGDTDFELVEALKYWRFRLYALPSHQPGTKVIMDGAEHCDVYTKLSPEDQINMLEGFLKFIEGPINKIKRSNTKKTLNIQMEQRRRHSTGIAFLYSNTQEPSIILGKNGLEKMPLRKSASKGLIERQRAASDVTMDSDLIDYQDRLDFIPLKETATNLEIRELLLHSNHGLEFLPKYPSLPSNTFVSYDAVQWMKRHVEKVCKQSDAVKKLEAMRKEKWICHASGDFSHPFIFGFYLYYIPGAGESPKLTKDFSDPICDLITFKNEWVEVETKPLPPPFKNKCPIFLQKDLPSPCCGQQATPYKKTHLEVDIGGKSDRIEWGHLKFHSEFWVDRGFELVVQWIAASGPVISDLISNFARKAQTYNLQLVPIPADPHALPYALKSDPLRGPIYIPLDLECVMGCKSYLFEDFPESTWNRRLLLFQEEIACKFGFVACKGETNADSGHHNQYIHVTGNAFLLIVTSNEEASHSCSEEKCVCIPNKPSSRARLKEETKAVISPHQEYITKHVTTTNAVGFKSDNKAAFLFSWNHMIGRRWKGSNPATNDEAFQDKLLRDFREFCSNCDRRLSKYWESFSSDFHKI